MVRLFGTCLCVLLLIGTGLYMVQSRDARQIVIDDAAHRHGVQGQLLEDAYASATVGEDPWSEVRQVLAQVDAVTEAEEVIVVDQTGLVVAASDEDEEGTFHLGKSGRAVLATGETVFKLERYDGQDLFEFLSAVNLGGERYVFEVEFAPELLHAELTALKRSALQALAVSLLIALPLLYVLGGRALAGQFGAAAERASRDGLTGLHNHRSFQESLQQEVARAQRYGESLTLALIDVDDFKVVNDVGGHRRGDEVLVALSSALGTGRSTDLAFRIGGDEFALLLPHTDAGAAATVVSRLRHVALSRMGGTTISVGLAQLELDGDADGLRDRADAALYEAKRRGRDQVTTFSEIVSSAVPSAGKSSTAGLRALLSGQHMDAAFQPIWDLPNGQVLGYEGLARPDQGYGLSGPAEAFSAAARTGKVDELDALCRKAILAAAKDLPTDALLFLNIAPQVLDHGNDAAQRLQQEVVAAGLRPERIVLELTERASERMDLVLVQLQQLRALGFQLALDDVGAGDTGLALLAKVRPDFIKLDRSVVVDALAEGPGRAVLAAVTAYAWTAGAAVIAEGIETPEMLDMVRSAHLFTFATPITGGQGYLLGRPTDRPWTRPDAALPGPLAALHVSS